MESSNKTIGKYFDGHAEGWDAKTYTQEHKKRIPHIINSLGIEAGSFVLDIGTGTGILLPHLLEHITEIGRIIALDISSQMIKTARQRYATKNIDFIQGQVEYLPLETSTADVAVCFSVFPHFQHHPRALTELNRVIKKGGELFILHLEGSESLNRFHSSLEGPVTHHRLPASRHMKELLESCFWSVTELRDNETEYYVHCIKR